MNGRNAHIPTDAGVLSNPSVTAVFFISKCTFCSIQVHSLRIIDFYILQHVVLNCLHFNKLPTHKFIRTWPTFAQ